VKVLSAWNEIRKMEEMGICLVVHGGSELYGLYVAWEQNGKQEYDGQYGYILRRWGKAVREV
jgi:hypothetical protein